MTEKPKYPVYPYRLNGQYMIPPEERGKSYMYPQGESFLRPMRGVILDPNQFGTCLKGRAQQFTFQAFVPYGKWVVLGMQTIRGLPVAPDGLVPKQRDPSQVSIELTVQLRHRAA